MNEFEQKLKGLSPELYELYVLSKDELSGGGGETNLQQLAKVLSYMNDQKSTGSLWVNYQKGKIDSISIKTEIPLKHP